MTFYDMTWLERLLFLKRIKGGGSGHEETTTSNVFVTDMVAPLRKLLLSFAPKQSGSGDPSPTNIRPISGWEECNLTRADVLVDETYAYVTRQTLNDSGDVVTSGASAYKRTEYLDVSNRTLMTVKLDSTYNGGWTFRICGYDINHKFKGLIKKQTIGNSGAYSYEFNVSEYSYIRISRVSSNVIMTVVADAITYTADFGQIVYGGTLDMVSGVLTVTQKLVDLGSLAWSVQNEYFRTAVQSDAKKGANGVLSNAHCSALVVSSPNGFLNTNNSITVATDGRFTAYSTAWTGWTGEQVQEALDGVMFAYELDTPIAYQLTPQQINTLIGTNNILTDAEVSEIVYLKKAE